MSSIIDDIRMRWNTGGMVIRLIFVNLGVFVLLATLGLLVTLGVAIPDPGGAFGLATTSDPARLLYRPWSIVTHMFVHLGIWHLVMNLLILWWMGGMFRSYFGDRRTLSTYLMGGCPVGSFISSCSTSYPDLEGLVDMPLVLRQRSWP